MNLDTVLRRSPAWVLLAFLSVALSAIALVAQAQEQTTSISGSVVNGTAGASVPSDVQVSLSVFYNNRTPDQRTTTADGQGRFAFPAVPIQDVASYSIAAMYLGINYAVQLQPGSDLTNVLLTVYEVTSSMDGLSIKGNTLLVLKAKPATRTLAFLEIVQIANQGDRTFMPQSSTDGSMSFLRFPLPSNAADLDVQAELPEGQVLQVDKGFALASPVPPGTHNVIFGYTAPYSSANLDLSRSFLMGTSTFRMLVSEDVGSISSPQMTDMGNTTIGSTKFHLLEAKDLPPEAGISILLQGLPQPSLVQRLQGVFSRVSWPMVIPVVMATAMAILLLAGLRRRSSLKQPALDRASLIQAIASLDDQFQGGKLREAQYQQQRQVLMERLLKVATQGEAMS